MILMIPLQASGQSVGLVLSGGGSKGLAHIGVIKALEENRIPIDYIGGTSMGAIIGSFYAMGLTTEEMIRIIQSAEFSYWMSGELKEKDKYYFKAEYPGPDIVRIGLDLKDTVPKTILPLSIIPNHLMDFAFRSIPGPVQQPVTILTVCLYHFYAMLQTSVITRKSSLEKEIWPRR